jgi:hypothetical protein
MKHMLCLALTIGVLAGCAAPLSVAPRTTTLIKLPSLNVETEAEIGQSMITTAKKAETPAIEITNEVSHSDGRWTLSISPGVLPMFASNDNGSFYRVQGAVVLTTLGIRQPNSIGGIYIPSDKSKPTEVFWIGPYGTPVNSAHAGIEFKKTTFEQWDKESFKRELVYSGVSQNTISILYREFLNDMARPAFSQDLKYDLSQGNAIGYKGARFEVIKANNTAIVYKVLKPLD